MPDSKNEKLGLLINSSVSLVAVLLGSFVSFHFAQVGDIDKRKYELNRQALSTVLEKTIEYSNYRTVDWDRIAKLERAYNCVFGDEVERILWKHDKESIPGIYCDHSKKLMNAKDEFHRLSTGARITGSPDVVEALAHVEDGFDEVMLRIAKSGHYLRALIDNYNAVMPDRFERLEAVFRKEVY